MWALPNALLCSVDDSKGRGILCRESSFVARDMLQCRRIIYIGMKKVILTSALLGVAAAGYAREIKLPAPAMDNPMTLMTALAERHSSREFSERQISDNELSTILWAACGINRPESGRITAPSAINAQDIRLYVIRQDGAYLYNAVGHSLSQVSDKDLRAMVAGAQEFAATAPLSLLLVSDHDKFGELKGAGDRMGLIDSGYVSQNICLACTALGLNNVPRMSMNADGLRKELSLGDNFDLTANHIIGYPVE